MSNRKSDYITKLLPRIDLNKAITENTSKQQLFLQDKAKDFSQDWYFIGDELGAIIKNVQSGKILGCTRGMDTLQMFPENTKSTFCRWKIITAESSIFSKEYNYITNVAYQTKVLEVVNANAQDGSAIRLTENTRSHSQMFYLDRQTYILNPDEYEPEKLAIWHLEENEYKSYEDLKYKILSSDHFLKKWSNLAAMLGFSWPCGTAANEVGKDYSIVKEGDHYNITANYRAHDKYANTHRANERLKMVVSDVKLVLDHDSIKIGEQSIENLEPKVIASTNSFNNTASKAMIRKGVNHDTNRIISVSTPHVVSNDIKIARPFKVEILGVDTDHTFAYNFSDKYSLGAQIAEYESNVLNHSFEMEAPAGSSVPADVHLYHTEAIAPYTAIARLEYKITLIGFLSRYGNGYQGNPKDEPTISYTFGTDTLSASEDLYDKYLHRNESGYSVWDFDAMLINERGERFKKIMSEAITPVGTKVSGEFKKEASKEIVISSRKS